MKNTQRKISKINQIANAWESMAPDAAFAGMTLAQFKEQIKPAMDSTDRILNLQVEVRGERKRWVDNTQSCLDVAKRAVNGVLADPNFGGDCPLYSAMGYVRIQDRKSGLTRKPADPTPAQKN